MDNDATHGHPEVLAWLADHPRRTFHFTPTSGSWLNAVEGFFSKPARQTIRRGVFRSVDDRIDTIDRDIQSANHTDGQNVRHVAHSRVVMDRTVSLSPKTMFQAWQQDLTISS